MWSQRICIGTHDKGDDDAILELRVVVSKLGRRGEMIKPTRLGESDGGGENGDGKEVQETEWVLLLWIEAADTWPSSKHRDRG